VKLQLLTFCPSLDQRPGRRNVSKKKKGKKKGNKAKKKENWTIEAR
jgi:hypothetical protein